MPEFTPLLLATAVRLPPEKAVAFLKQKGFAFSWRWDDTLDSAHNQVFTVAKAMKMDVLKDIRDEVTSAVKQGTTFRNFQKQLEPKLRAKGWWGREIVDGQNVQLGSPHRLRTIYNTNTQAAFNAGRYKEQLDNKDERPFLMHVSVIDPNTRALGLALDGQVHAVGSAHWDTFYPPNEFNDRGRVRSLSMRQAPARIDAAKKAQAALRKDGQPTADSFKHPDVGFDNNPGKVPWKPQASDYPKDLWTKGQALEKLRRVLVAASTAAVIRRTPAKDLPE
jgi:uncharacterized protein with gpF-like domain